MASIRPSRADTLRRARPAPGYPPRPRHLRPRRLRPEQGGYPDQGSRRRATRRARPAGYGTAPGGGYPDQGYRPAPAGGYGAASRRPAGGYGPARGGLRLRPSTRRSTSVTTTTGAPNRVRPTQTRAATPTGRLPGPGGYPEQGGGTPTRAATEQGGYGGQAYRPGLRPARLRALRRPAATAATGRATATPATATTTASSLPRASGLRPGLRRWRSRR